MRQDQEAQKRAIPEGTPDTEADARRNMFSTTTIVPKASSLEAGAPVLRVEMSALIIAALCAMMRGEIKTGIFEMEHRSTNQLDRTIGRSASAT